jgi:outer membrane protein TolC
VPPPGYTANPPLMPTPSRGAIRLNAQRIEPPLPPETQIPSEEVDRLEGKRNPGSVFLHQWSAISEVPPEVLISERYLRTRDNSAASLTLKEALYLALQNNPGLQADRMDPLGSLQSVRISNATFDPLLSGRLDVLKNVTPSTSVLQNAGASTNSYKQYDWDFGATKVLASTNGTLSLAFDNYRAKSNSVFASVNPSYNPSLTLSLSQPLLQNFGINFATLNVRIAEYNQKQSQFQFEGNISDFMLRVSTDYWNVVRAEENLQVAHEGYNLARDLVRQNEISVRVGVLAPLDIKQAQSEEATNAALVFAAENTLAINRATLRQDVMLNPSDQFLPKQIEPAEVPGESEAMLTDEEQSLELAMWYRPELAAMRQELRSVLLQVQFAENQTLPQLNLGAQFGVTDTAGSTICTPNLSPSSASNCTASNGSPGSKLPFGGIYGDALRNMWNGTFYNYAAVLNFQQPLMNDAAKAAYAQTKIEYEQTRLRYRDLISQIVVDVQSALSTISTNSKQVHATNVAAEYAAESLRAEQERFRVGMATTHELLQFQDTLVGALGNQVQARCDLEIAKLALKHAEGTLLRAFNVNFVPEDPHAVTPWYARF